MKRRPIDIRVVTVQSSPGVNLAWLRRLAGWLAARALGETDGRELVIALTDDAGIADVNRRFLDRPHPTDVIAFAYDPSPGQPGAAEIVINVQRAREEGARRGGADRELALYLAHGLDHLAGADDATPRQRAAMLRREHAWLRAATAAGLLE